MPMAPSLLLRAVNTAANSENRIHDDRVAAGYGFRGGLVPGVTIHGYMASAVISHLGPAWLDRGAMDVRFFQPFYEGEDVAVSVASLDQGKIKVDAGSRAAATAWIESEPPDSAGLVDRPPCDRLEPFRESLRPGTVLGTIEKTLDLSQPGMSAPLDAWIGPARLAHPAIVLALANEILVSNYNLGPWIHSGSEIRNASAVRDGDRVRVGGKIVDAYERKGHELVVLDVVILCGERLVSRIRHTAIWRLRS